MSSKEKNSTEDVEGFWKALWKPYIRWLWGSGLGILVIVSFINESSGGGGMFFVVTHSLNTVVTEIGFAFIIAALLSASIEESTRRQFYAEMDSRIIDIQKNVFRSTYRRDLPDQFFNEVEELLFRCEFSHSNYRIEYDFKRPRFLTGAGSPHVMDVKIRHLFSIRNLTAIAAEHCIYLQIHEIPSLGVDVSCSKIVSAVLFGYRTFEEKEIEKINGEAVSEGGLRTFRIQTGEVRPGEEIQVEIAAESIKWADGFVFCRCLTPSRGLTVIAKFPPEIDPERVGADTAHRTPCKPDLLGHGVNEFSWLIEGAVLPSQGINFWWACDLAKMSKDNQ